MSGLCPHHGRALVARRIEGGSKVEVCPTCHGLWLAPALVAGRVGHALRPDTAAALPPARPFAALPCPVDGSGMRALRHRGVEIDLCARCRGVWLDAGELERLLLPAAAGGPDAAEMVEGALDMAFDVGESWLDGRRPGARLSSLSSSEAAQASGLDDGTLLLVERMDTAAAADSVSGILDGAGDALGAVFEFVGDALSGI